MLRDEPPQLTGQIQVRVPTIGKLEQIYHVSEVWSNLAKLTITIAKDLKLTPVDISNSNIVALVAT